MDISTGWLEQYRRIPVFKYRVKQYPLSVDRNLSRGNTKRVFIMGKELKIFWTAGQRIDLCTASRLVWRVITSTDTALYTTTVSDMKYTNWQLGTRRAQRW